MRVGRLRSSTLSNILRSIEAQDDFKNLSDQNPFPVSTKQYIPLTADSPLFRLVTVLHSGRSATDLNASATTTPRETHTQSDLIQAPPSQREGHTIHDIRPGEPLVRHASRSQFLERRSRSELHAALPSQSRQNMLQLEPEPQNRAASLPNMLQTSQQSLDLLPAPRPPAPLPTILPIPLAQTPLRHSAASVSPDLVPDEMDVSVEGRRSTSSVLSSSLSLRSLPHVARLDECDSESKSPAEIARSSTIPHLKPNILDADKSPNEVDPLPWTKEYSHIDIEWSMQAMDVLYNASFYDYIRDEKNVDLASIRLARVVKDYKPRQVSSAIRWMIQGWSIEATAKLLRVVFSDWLPDLAGCVFALISKDWPQKPQVSLCCAYLLIAEPPTVSALFLRSVTGTWEKESITELIGYLDHILEWDEDYFQELMTIYSELIKADLKKISSSESSSHSLVLQRENEADKMLEYLASLYKNSLAMTNYKIALADARLALAEYNLQVCQHLMSCETCQKNETCAELADMNPPEIPSLPNLTWSNEGFEAAVHSASHWEDDDTDHSPTEKSNEYGSSESQSQHNSHKLKRYSLDTERSGSYSDLGSRIEIANAAHLVSLLSTESSAVALTGTGGMDPLESNLLVPLTRADSKEHISLRVRSRAPSETQR